MAPHGPKISSRPLDMYLGPFRAWIFSPCPPHNFMNWSATLPNPRTILNEYCAIRTILEARSKDEGTCRMMQVECEESRSTMIRWCATMHAAFDEAWCGELMKWIRRYGIQVLYVYNIEIQEVKKGEHRLIFHKIFSSVYIVFSLYYPFERKWSTLYFGSSFCNLAPYFRENLAIPS